MLPTGHIASALIVNRLVRLDAGPAPAVLGALVPDAIDKTLAWVLDVVPSARHIGHTPFAAAVLSAIAAALFGRQKGLAFGVAYMSHLLGDRWGDGHIPWLMPMKSYHQQGVRWNIKLSADLILLELVGAVIIVVLLRTPDGPGPAI